MRPVAATCPARWTFLGPADAPQGEPTVVEAGAPSEVLPRATDRDVGVKFVNEVIARISESCGWAVESQSETVTLATG